MAFDTRQQGAKVNTTTPMLETYPAEINLDLAGLAATIDALMDSGEACAGACLSEGLVAELTKSSGTRRSVAST